MQLLSHERIFPLTPCQIFNGSLVTDVVKGFPEAEQIIASRLLSSVSSQFPLKPSEGGGAQLLRFSLLSSANSLLVVCVSPCNYSVTMAFAVCLPQVSDLVACISLHPLQHLKENSITCHPLFSSAFLSKSLYTGSYSATISISIP